MRTALLAQLLCSAIESIANQALSLSDKPVNFAEKYQSSAMALNLAELGFTLEFRYIASKLLVTSPEQTIPEQTSAECTITTSLSTLNKIRSEHQLTELIKADKLDIVGDMKVAQQFIGLAESIEIDWATAIEAHIGDVATHKLLSLAANAQRKLAFAKAQVSADMTEYVLHEQQWVVSASELRHFTQGVTSSQQSVEQLSQRVAALTEKMTQLDH
ncbi:hypothetical protein DXX93_20215 [Thalassotalea euphylliae]|uniref:Ubiquinone biosynthesis accessory factor UbiJ n=1 Tax=Thalassotalea euphylliae TaxID=1655234 RepID=A0A3E0TW60_9GAMM|nr:SCP2 sterol-binding domain-containing protein [Thalassotalea euphylliae]REL28660.1 hypothetical protein DXX93_20215 [Thalassotalea euphylliae]